MQTRSRGVALVFRAGLVLTLALASLSSPATARGIHRQGTASFGSGSHVFDLDAGTHPTDYAKVDFQQVDSEVIFIAPGLNKSRMSKRLDSKPSYQKCRDYPYRKNVGAGASADGAWFCFRTSAGRFARVQVTHWPTTLTGPIRFRYLVWE